MPSGRYALSIASTRRGDAARVIRIEYISAFCRCSSSSDPTQAVVAEAGVNRNSDAMRFFFLLLVTQRASFSWTQLIGVLTSSSCWRWSGFAE